MSATSIQSVRPTRHIGAWTLQGILAAAFLAAGFTKLAGVPFMVDLFEQIGLGQWFRVATGIVEVTGAVALLVPGLAPIGALWLGFTMVGAVSTHVFVLHTSPDRKSTRLNSSHSSISYAVFCLKKKKKTIPCKTSKKKQKTEKSHQ